MYLSWFGGQPSTIGPLYLLGLSNVISTLLKFLGFDLDKSNKGPLCLSGLIRLWIAVKCKQITEKLKLLDFWTTLLNHFHLF